MKNKQTITSFEDFILILEKGKKITRNKINCFFSSVNKIDCVKKKSCEQNKWRESISVLKTSKYFHLFILPFYTHFTCRQKSDFKTEPEQFNRETERNCCRAHNLIALRNIFTVNLLPLYRAGTDTETETEMYNYFFYLN